MNSLKNKLIMKDVVLGTMISEVSNPNIVRMMKQAGFGFIIVDCEHGYFDFPQLAAIASVGNGFQMPVLVRVPAIDRGFITKALDMSCDGLLVPMVNTAEEAQHIVDYAKYLPLGRRGISTTRAHADYNPPVLAEYVRTANDRTIVFVQLETRIAINNAREIAEIDGIDALIIGPNDLAADMGTPGCLDTLEMEEAINSVIIAAKNVGKPCGIVASKIPFLKKWEKAGMSIFSCNSETGMIMESAKNIVKTFTVSNN